MHSAASTRSSSGSAAARTTDRRVIQVTVIPSVYNTAMGPLEQEVVEQMDRTLRGTPDALEALFRGDTGVHEASAEETAQFLIAMLIAHRDAIRRIAREIDELRST
jgi:ABC-type transporter Mla subunit MlaD